MRSYRTSISALRIIFVAAEVGLLVWWLVRLDGRYDNEDFLFFQLLLVAIGFPSAAVGWVLLSLMDLLVPFLSEHTKPVAIVIWLVLGVVTYLQWFVWLPKMVQRLRSWWSRRSETL